MADELISRHQVYYSRNKEAVRAEHQRYYKSHKEQFDRKRDIARRRNREFINREKMRPCVDCKIQYGPWVMQFDHVRGEKFADIAKMSNESYSITRLQEEIEKCDLVCANCHAQRTHVRRQQSGR